MHILLVEDDARIASFILKGLRAAGYAVDHTPPKGRRGCTWPSRSPTTRRSST